MNKKELIKLLARKYKNRYAAQQLEEPEIIIDEPTCNEELINELDIKECIPNDGESI